MRLKRMQRSLQTAISLTLVLVFIYSLLLVDAAAAKKSNLDTDIALGYDEYINSYSDAEYPEIVDTVTAFSVASCNVKHFDADGEAAFEMLEKNTEISFSTSVKEAGLYAIKLKCLLSDKTTSKAHYSVTVNGEILNRQLENLLFPEIFCDGDITVSVSGDDVRPEKTQIYEWTEFFICDHNYNEEYMPIYLKSGVNLITLTIDTAGIAVTAPVVTTVKQAQNYEEYLSQNPSSAKLSNYIKTYQAEKSYRTSGTELYPTYDRAGASTIPNDAKNIKLNTIGQSTWNAPGQWIEWEIEAPEDGYYNIGVRARQNESRGFTSNRKLSIDGEVPFIQCEALTFHYDMQWYVSDFGDGENAYRFYLTKGRHILRLEAVFGDVGDNITSLESIVNDLNTLYRKIIMITGTSESIDSWRDYMLKEQIPELEETLKVIKQRIENEQKVLLEKGFNASEYTAQLIYQLETFLKDDEQIPKKLSDFRSNISSLSAFAQSLRNQPLELDYIYVKTIDVEKPKSGVNIFSSLAFRFKLFLASYVTDYSDISESADADKKITVWSAAGRDQSQAVMDIINNYYTPQTGIAVSLSIMQSGINEAVAAGRNPDVLIFGATEVVPLAARGVLADISQYSKFDVLCKRFSDSALVPFTYQDGVYAVPLEQYPLMMFYRKDIFNELGLEVPKNWDEFIEVLTILQNNKLTAGLSAGTAVSGNISLYELFVYQRGGNILSEDLQTTLIDDEINYSAFKQWTDLFTKHNLEPEVQFFERFRSGEIPLAIQSLAVYSQLKLGAPEINGLWGMAQVPQYVYSDGSVSNLTVGSYTPAIVFKNACEEDCFAFIDWLTSAEIQQEYGKSVESLLGVGARYYTANLEAVGNMNWTADEAEIIISQMKNMTLTPVVPANYYIARNITNAFRRVYNNGYHPREAILMYKSVIDSEIQRKNDEIRRQSERWGNQ